MHSWIYFLIFDYNQLNIYIMKNLKEEFEKLNNQIIVTLINLVKTSGVPSKHISYLSAIPVNIFDYKELVYLNDKLVFLDDNGLHFDLYSDCNQSDLIDIIEQEEGRQNNILDLQWIQSELKQEIINKASINIVTCGNCGSVVLHKIGCQKITCHDCGFTSDSSDFPDLYNS